ncbi:ABC transporter permease [Nocardia carnea]|uniref:ABC transporter permease n=1 Tax=Nocardia carnea TaxID=37328 RepID=UPI0024581D7F|nr:ABC transporter permease [Nocardia carnea]
MIDVVPAELIPPVLSEYRKAVTLRYTRVLAGLAVATAVVAPAVSALMAGPLDPRGEPVTGTATIGLYLALLAVVLGSAAFGAAGAAGEHQHDTLVITTLFTVDRDRLAGAKFLVTGLAALAAALAVEIVAMVCLLLFGRDKFEITGSLFAVLGGGLVAAVCWAVIGTGIGLLLRAPLLAIGAVLGWLLIAEPLLWVVTAGIGIPGAATLLPGSATLSTLFPGSFTDADLLAPAPAAIVVLLLWTVGISAWSWWSLRRAEL